MKLKRNWTIGIIATVSVLILAASGGESTLASPPPLAPQGDLVAPTPDAQPATFAPTTAAEATVAPAATDPPPFPRDCPGIGRGVIQVRLGDFDGRRQRV